ncbi:isocitrate/isopropylmalate dehydrogenase family protein [Polymorphum gilvum]|uniref:Probable 3-isopropylmalate dehydrogenase oxidoreductase protein n=1 Tax=Polymorphum gilvum (strain LMG 25793 / CGMCC 1.9160 / SL003B-26A1) TaxID=991905 RepID=F2J3Z3_POLGS|nr:isocitrate/isopropylmalate family dehydrogenase [Polymorphum gilvum]ADZ68975.1 Probable 3-isopropylmalate dehydrogenase oxidoreductase protein [Polymorphum gilvum SL003B-26A1]
MDLLVLPGDGIGPEITDATVRVLRTADTRFRLGLSLSEDRIGLAALKAEGTTLPERVRERALAADGVVLGPVSHNEYPPVAQGGINPSGALRKQMQLYANIRPARSRPGLPTPIARPVDLVVMRENLEGFYADRTMFAGGGEFMPVPGVALAMRKITADGSRRIAEAAFALAATRPARRVAAIHKQNVMRMSDGLFLDEVRAVAKAYPDIAYEEVLVDSAAALLVRAPERFDVLVTTNMFGDILSDLASELAGGLGLAASLNLGADHAVAQAQHGSAPDIAGKDLANPTSLIVSSAMLLRHLGATAAADAIEAAIDAALAHPETRTRDLGGALGTAAFADTVSRLIEDIAP